jgi:hypothetical protein
LLLVPVALAGTTVLVGGLGELWVTGVGRTRRPVAVWLPAVMSGTVAATAALWAAPQAQSMLDGAGWPLLAAWLTTPGALALPGVAAVVLAVAAGWALRRGRDSAAPAWWGGAATGDRALGRGAVVVGLAAGVAGGFAFAAFRVVAGAPTSDADAIQRVDAGVLGAGLVGVVAVAILGLARGPAGAGSGLLAGPVASVTTAALFLVVVVAAGGNPLPFAAHVVGGAAAAGFLLAVPAALVGTLPIRPVRVTALLAGAAVVAGATVATSVAVARQSLVPGLSAVLPGYSEVDGGPTPNVPVPVPDPVVPRELYADVVARPLLDGRVATAEAFAALKAERPPNAESVSRIRTEILPVLRQMLDGAESVRLDDPEVQQLHGHAIAAARAHVVGFETIANALERNDPTMLREGNSLLAQGNSEWEQWAAGVLAL